MINLSTMPTIVNSNNIDNSSTKIFDKINKSIININESNKTSHDDLLTNEKKNDDSTFVTTNTLPLFIADAIARIFFMTIKWAKTLPPFSVLNLNDQV